MDHLWEFFQQYAKTQPNASRILEAGEEAFPIMGEYVRNLFEHDPGTGHHSLKVGIKTPVVAIETGFTEASLVDLIIAGTLHDYGKLKVDGGLLRSPVRYSQNSPELQEIRKHPEYARQLLNGSLPPIVKPVACGHHDQFGEEFQKYPRKDSCRIDLSETDKRTKDAAILRSVKLVAVVEMYSAIVDPTRPYRPAEFGPRRLVSVFYKEVAGDMECMKYFFALQELPKFSDAPILKNGLAH